MMTITINGKRIQLERAVTILEAARAAGIHIPTLCHDESLEPYGGCRLCLVEIENVPRLQTACTQWVTDGMAVWTETEKVVEARKGVLEFLLINHPLDCPYCDKAGECDLQDLAMKYGPATGRFAEGKRRHPESFEDPLIARNMERCILCTKCVRMCDDVQGASAISVTDRGSRSFVEPFSGGRYNCEYCGNCLTVCPVGAITSRLHRHGYRPWLIEKEVETVCPHCGVGCSMVLQTRGNSVVRGIPRADLGLNKGIMCVRGRFGYDYRNGSERLDTPLIRRNGALKPAAWSEAMTHIAGRLKEVKERYGSEAIAGIASARCTNEDAYVFQKFFRSVIGCNNIDSSASLGYGPSQRFLERIFGQGVTANLIYGISNSDGVVIIGDDPAALNPVLGLHVRSAHKKGVPVVSVGYAKGLERFARHGLVPNPRTGTVLLAAMVSGMRNMKTLTGERPSFERIINDMQFVSLEEAAAVCGIGVSELMKAMDALSGMSNPSVIVGRGVVQTENGQINLLLLAALVYLLNGRIYLLSELPNEQGLLDMGCQPDVLPCGRPLAVEAFRKRCSEVLGSGIPSSPGLGFTEMIEAAHSGRIRALYAMDENVALSLPGRDYVEEGLKRLDLLVVQDCYLTETARLAEVVLPAPSWAEKEGSYTNLERRIQFTGKAVDGKGVEEWRVITEIGKILGLDMGFRDLTDILDEIARVSLIYRDITYEDVKSGACIWPYKGEPLRHDAHMADIEQPDIRAVVCKSDGDAVFVRREASLFHSENASRYSQALRSVSPVPYARMSTALAEALSVEDGEHVVVSSDKGNIRLSVRLDPCLPKNLILVPNVEDHGICGIMKWKIDPATKVPVIDGNEVTVRRHEGEPS